VGNKPLIIGCLCLFVTFGNVMLADEQLPDGAKMLATNLEYRQFAQPAISPDGTRLTFVDKGELYLYSFGDEAPHAIENAQSFYSLIKDPAADLVELSFDAAAAGRREDDLIQENATAVFHSMAGLAWTFDSEAILCSIAHPPNPPSRLLTYCIRPIDGKLRALSTLVQPQQFPGFNWQLTRDQRFLIFNRGDNRPLICGAATNRPVATPYDALAASPTSDRWIGVEKDSLRFVILDKNWNVLERTKFTAPRSESVWRRQLEWSADERFVLYHHQIGSDHHNEWLGIWLDLQSGNKQELEGLGHRQIAFVGRDGTWATNAAIGKRNEQFGGYRVFGRYIELKKPRERSLDLVWRWEERWEPNQRGYRWSLVPNSEFTQFIAKRRDPKSKDIYELSLMDRKKQAVRLAVLDAQKPFGVIGFANGDRELVIVSDARLISLPLPAGGEKSTSQ
jgi:hypothetical protein